MMMLPAQAVIGVVGTRALPGDAAYAGSSAQQLVEEALEEARVMAGEGIDALMLQNIAALPTGRRTGALSIAWMTRIAGEIRRHVDVPLGISCLEDDPVAVLSIADAVEAAFVRLKVYVGAMVGPDGIREGSAHAAQTFLRDLASRPAIYADVYDRTRTPLGTQTLGEMVHEATWFGRADGLVLTGRHHAETLEFLREGRRHATVPLLAGGGATPETIGPLLESADGVIVATYLKRDGQLLNPVDRTRVRALMNAAAAQRGRPR